MRDFISHARRALRAAGPPPVPVLATYTHGRAMLGPCGMRMAAWCAIPPSAPAGPRTPRQRRDRTAGVIGVLGPAEPDRPPSIPPFDTMTPEDKEEQPEQRQGPGAARSWRWGGAGRATMRCGGGFASLEFLAKTA